MPPSNTYAFYRHGTYWPQRRRLYETLKVGGCSGKTLRRFELCGSNATVLQHKSHPDRLKIGCFKCRHRLCHACQRETAGIIRSNLEILAATAKNRLSLLTLTLAHTEARLRPTIARLLTAFRDLRRLLPWKRAVLGAAWVLEVKIGKDGKWHPHLHILMNAIYLEVGWITAAWKGCTGDSTNAHIKRISATHGANYIAKYVSKPIDDTVWKTNAALEEFISATHRQRKCATLGKWRGCKLATPSEDPEVYDTSESNCPKNWQVLCTVQDLIWETQRGDETARQIFDKLFTRKKGTDP